MESGIGLLFVPVIHPVATVSKLPLGTLFCSIILEIGANGMYYPLAMNTNTVGLLVEYVSASISSEAS